MRRILQITALIALGVLFAPAQDAERPTPAPSDKSKVQKKKSVDNRLTPAAADIAEARKSGFEVFRLFPRGLYDMDANPFSVRGGGAYYSFAKKSHDYNEVPQIELQKGEIMVGFAGADYGLIADLGAVPLASVDRENKSLEYLLDYRPAVEDPQARSEFLKIREGVTVDGLIYRRSLPVKIGHTYLLRSINYDKADTLVALSVARQDADGSLVIFWKLIESFAVPVLKQG